MASAVQEEPAVKVYVSKPMSVSGALSKARELFSAENFGALGLKSSFLALLYLVFTGFFIALYMIALAVRGNDFMELPDKASGVDNDVPQVQVLLPWAIVSGAVQ